MIFACLLQSVTCVYKFGKVLGLNLLFYLVKRNFSLGATNLLRI